MSLRENVYTPRPTLGSTEQDQVLPPIGLSRKEPNVNVTRSGTEITVYCKRDTDTKVHVTGEEYSYGQYNLIPGWEGHTGVELISVTVVGIQVYSSIRFHGPQS